MDAERDRLLLVPVSWTLYSPAEPVQDRVDAPPVVVELRLIDPKERLQVRPDEGSIVVVNETLPVNPFKPLTVTVAVPETPARAETLQRLV